MDVGGGARKTLEMAAVESIAEDESGENPDMFVMESALQTYAKKLVKLLAAWRADDYNAWMETGFCLYNINTGLKDTWIEFSQRSHVRHGVGAADVRPPSLCFFVFFFLRGLSPKCFVYFVDFVIFDGGREGKWAWCRHNFVRIFAYLGTTKQMNATFYSR
jgi:hypothetical protein